MDHTLHGSWGGQIRAARPDKKDPTAGKFLQADGEDAPQLGERKKGTRQSAVRVHQLKLTLPDTIWWITLFFSSPPHLRDCLVEFLGKHNGAGGGREQSELQKCPSIWRCVSVIERAGGVAGMLGR